MPVLRISSIQDDCICDHRPVFVDPEDYKEDLSRYEVHDGDLLIAMSGATTGKIGFNNTGDVFLLNQRVGKFEPKENLDKKFLFYFLSTKVEENLAISAGAAQPNLSTKQIKEFQIPFPPLEEQKRIVAVLDEAFAALDRARIHAGTNAQSARELFESYLDGVFAAGGKGWANATIEECLKVKSGDFLPKKAMDSEGDIPVVGGNGKTGLHNVGNLDGTNIVIGRVGAKCGNVHLLQGPIWLTDNAFSVSETFQDFDPEFLAMILRRADLGTTANQAAQPVISYKTIKPVILSFPTQRSAQSAIVAKANEIQRMTTQLETKYSTNLAGIEDLRQSLLKKAFSGELT